MNTTTKTVTTQKNITSVEEENLNEVRGGFVGAFLCILGLLKHLDSKKQ